MHKNAICTKLCKIQYAQNYGKMQYAQNYKYLYATKCHKECNLHEIINISIAAYPYISKYFFFHIV